MGLKQAKLLRKLHLIQLCFQNIVDHYAFKLYRTTLQLTCCVCVYVVVAGTFLLKNNINIIPREAAILDALSKNLHEFQVDTVSSLFLCVMIYFFIAATCSVWKIHYYVSFRWALNTDVRHILWYDVFLWSHLIVVLVRFNISWRF